MFAKRERDRERERKRDYDKYPRLWMLTSWYKNEPSHFNGQTCLVNDTVLLKIVRVSHRTVNKY